MEVEVQIFFNGPKDGPAEVYSLKISGILGMTQPEEKRKNTTSSS